MKKTSLFAAALAAGLMFPLAGAAQQPPPAGPGAPAQREARQRPERPRADRPRLTDTQRAEMRKLRDAHQDATRDAHRALRDLNIDLRKALAASELDVKRIDELKASILQHEATLDAARLDQRVRMAQLLTPEQRQAFAERGERGQRGERMSRRNAAGAHRRPTR